MNQSTLPPLTPELYGDGPAREPHLQVVDRWADCANFPDDDPRQKLEFLHRQMNEEANVLENAASNLVEFPDAEWHLRMSLARQAADEARHLLVYKRLLEDRGGHVGQYPVMNFQYRILRKIDSLIGRLAIQNRTFEAGGLDAVTFGVQQALDEGDAVLAQVYDAQGADEVCHIGFANEWINSEVRRNPRSMMQMARALSHGAKAFEEVFAGGAADVTMYGVASEERKLAGFSDDEIAAAHAIVEARRQQGLQGSSRPA